MTHKKYLFHAARTPKLYCCLHYTSIFQFGRERFTDEPLSNGERVKKPLKSDDFRGFWSEWGDSNSRHLTPKASALPTALHPDIQFFLHDTMRRRKKQVFRVCGRRCGQARFCESFSTGEFPPQATVPKASGSSLSGKWIGYLSSQKGRHTTNCANLEQTVLV